MYVCILLFVHAMQGNLNPFVDCEPWIQIWPKTGSLTLHFLDCTGCPQLLDWNKMEAEEGEITLIRQVGHSTQIRENP